MTDANRARASLARAFFSAGDNPSVAAAMMVTSLALLSLQDAIIKVTSGAISIWQFQSLRSALNLALLLGLVALFGLWRQLPAKRPWAIAVRSLALVGAMLCFFSGIPYLSLAEIAAGLYLYPLIVALLSSIVLGEPVGPERLAAVGVGFLGSMLILKPGTVAFDPVSLLPIAAGVFYALMVLTTRKLCRGESPLALACGVAIAFLSVGLAGLAVFPAAADAGPEARRWSYLLTGWHALEVWVILAVIACSLLNLSANVMLARAYQSAEPSWLAPFDYSYLAFAALWGYAIWGTVPDTLTLIGMAAIATAGMFVAARKSRGPGDGPPVIRDRDLMR